MVGGRMDLSSSPHLLFLLKKVLPILSHPSTRRTSAPLRVRSYSSSERQSLSIPLQDSLRFFRHLSLYLHQHALRLACPKRGEGMGLPRSTYLTTNTLGPLSLSVGILPVSDVHKPIRTAHLPFWFKPTSSFGLSMFTAVTSVHLR